MNKWLWGFAALLFVLGLAAVLRYGLKPQPVRMIKPGYVASSEEAGFYVWKRLRHILKDETRLVFGIQNQGPEHYLLAKGVLEGAKAEGIDFATKITEQRLVNEYLPEMEGWEKIDSNKDSDRLFSLFSQSQSALLILPVVYASHLINETPLAILEKSLAKKIMTISIVRIALSAEELPQLQPPCDTEGTMSYGSISALGCAAQRKSSSNFRRNFDRKRYVLALDQTGQNDFLVYLHTPVFE